MKKIVIISVLVILLIVFLVWIFIASSKSVPGGQLEDEGREHVGVGTEVTYKTNPPTSGKHDVDWVRSGVYQALQDDRNLVHSLEHGYVIISYDCTRKTGLLRMVYAHGVEEEATGSAQVASSSATLSSDFRTEDCHNLVDQLTSIYESKGKGRLIVTPRLGMDARVVLTAWRRMEKFSITGYKLSDPEVLKVIKFIDVFRNQGPEKTME